MTVRSRAASSRQSSFSIVYHEPNNMLIEMVSGTQASIKIMTLMEGVCTNADEDLTTAGVEGLRSMLIFTAQSKVLTPDWVTPEGVNVWGVTWQKAHAISPNLSPEILH